MGVFGWLFGKKAQIVAKMPAMDAEALAKLTSQVSGHSITELEIAAFLAAGQIGQKDHIAFVIGEPTMTEAGRRAIQGLTAWLDNNQLYLVREKVSPEKSAKYLGEVPANYYVQAIFKELYGGTPLRRGQK